MNTIKDFKPVFFSPLADETSPAFMGEKRMLYFDRREIKDVQKKFIEELTLQTSKFPKSFAKECVEKSLEKNLIYLGRNIDGGKSGIYGRPLIIKDKLSGILLEITNLDIDISTGNSLSIDDCFYATYFIYLRAIVLINRISIRNDNELHTLCQDALFFLFLRLLSQQISFGDKEKTILKLILVYFYNKFLLYEQHPLCVKNSLEVLKNTDIDKSVFKPRIDNFKRYSSIKDIFKAMADLGLIYDNPNNYILIILRKLKPFGFHAITTSTDYLIALLIVSIYPVNFVGLTGYNPAIQNKIERHIMSNYSRNIQYDAL